MTYSTRNDHAEIAEQLRELKKINADLLAALELAEDLLAHDLGAGSEDFETIRSAIAKAKGQS